MSLDDLTSSDVTIQDTVPIIGHVLIDPAYNEAPKTVKKYEEIREALMAVGIESSYVVHEGTPKEDDDPRNKVVYRMGEAKKALAEMRELHQKTGVNIGVLALSLAAPAIFNVLPEFIGEQDYQGEIAAVMAVAPVLNTEHEYQDQVVARTGLLDGYEGPTNPGGFIPLITKLRERFPVQAIAAEYDQVAKLDDLRPVFQEDLHVVSEAAHTFRNKRHCAEMISRVVDYFKAQFEAKVGKPPRPS